MGHTGDGFSTMDGRLKAAMFMLMLCRNFCEMNNRWQSPLSASFDIMRRRLEGCTTHTEGPEAS